MIDLHRHATPDYARALHAERMAAGTKRRVRSDDLESLLTTAAANDAWAWNTLFARFEPHLLRVARGCGLSVHEAEDAVQDTWIRLFKGIARVREPRALAGWLTTTARREALRTHERAQRERPTEDELLADVADPGPPVWSQLDAETRRAELDRALAGLCPRDRRLMLALFADEPPSYVEIAALLDIPIGSIGPTRSRTLAKLRLNFRLRQLTDELE